MKNILLFISLFITSFSFAQTNQTVIVDEINDEVFYTVSGNLKSFATKDYRVQGDCDSLVSLVLDFQEYRNLGKVNLSVDSKFTFQDAQPGETYFLEVYGNGFDFILPDSTNTLSGKYDADMVNFVEIEIVSPTRSVARIETQTLPIPPAAWKDLRLGGDAFTDGNAAGNDIRYRTGMSMSRDASGMFFTGANIWSSWVKFESLSWTRGQNKRLQWIMTANDANMMIGIGSDATNEASTAQYAQMENEAYFTSANTLWGLYGNNGTVGSAANQNFTTSTPANAILKLVFEKDGEGQEWFYIYELPSANPTDWDDTSDLVISKLVGTNMNANETTIMPCILPRSGGTQRFIAVSIDEL